MSCCGKAEHAVYISGTLEGIRHEVVERWLQGITALRFVHIIKKQANGYGHVHFHTREDAGRFFHALKDRAYEGPAGGTVRFSAAAYFKSREKVSYIGPRKRTRADANDDAQDADANDGQRESPPAAIPFDVYDDDDNGIMHVVVQTPGVQSKADLTVSVGDDNRQVDLCAVVQPLSVRGKLVVRNIPSTQRLALKVRLPKGIDAMSPVKAEVKDGVTIVSLKAKGRRTLLIE